MEMKEKSELENCMIMEWRGELKGVEEKLEDCIRERGFDPQGIVGMKTLMEEEVAQVYEKSKAQIEEAVKKICSGLEGAVEYKEGTNPVKRFLLNTFSLRKKRITSFYRYLLENLPVGMEEYERIRRRVSDQFDGEVHAIDKNPDDGIACYYQAGDCYGVAEPIFWGMMVGSWQGVIKHERRHRYQRFSGFLPALSRSPMFEEGDARLHELKFFTSRPKSVVDLIRKFVSVYDWNHYRLKKKRDEDTESILDSLYLLSPGIMLFLERNGLKEEDVRKFYADSFKMGRPRGSGMIFGKLGDVLVEKHALLKGLENKAYSKFIAGKNAQGSQYQIVDK